MRIYLSIVKFNFLKFFSYPYEIVGGTTKRVCDLLLLLLFWSIVAKTNHINMEQIVSYFLIATSISNLGTFGALSFAGTINEMVQYGELNNYLIRPLNTILYLLATFTGRVGVAHIFSLTTFIIGVTLVHQTSLYIYLIFLLSVFYALVISVSVNVFVSIISFYTTEAKGIRNVMIHVLRLFSGLWIPLNFLPEQFKSVMFALPFSHVIYFPVHILQQKTLSNSDYSSVMISGIWAVVLPFFAYLLWKFSIKRYEAVGI
jgi:ABC-2 type transport system permease protein